MADKLTAVADLIDATTRLTDEVVLQKNLLKTAASTATAKSDSASLSAAIAKDAADKAKQITGWDTVEDAVEGLLATKAEKNAYNSTDLNSPIKVGDSLVKVDSVNETVMFTNALTGLTDVPENIGTSNVVVSFGGGTSYNTKLLFDITGKDGRIFQTHTRGYGESNVSGTREIHTSATPPRSYSSTNPLSFIKAGDSLLKSSSPNIAQDYIDGCQMFGDAPSCLSPNGQIISFGGGKYGSSFCTKFISDISIGGKLYHGVSRGYGGGNVSEWREIYTDKNPPKADKIMLDKGVSTEYELTSILARVVALESKLK